MPKKKPNYNATYISERLQESLRPISGYTLTTVVAPMGYGKTTAVNWFLSEREKAGDTGIIRISVYSGNLTIFWKSIQDAFESEGYDFLSGYPCPSDDVGGSLLSDAFCRKLRGKKPVYVFIDDFHLMTDHRVSDYICALAKRLPENVHLIIAGRDRFLPPAEILRLGNSVCQIGIEELRLNHTELSIYAGRCGATLSEDQITKLLYSSEGWFSAIYLNLRSLSGSGGVLPDRDSDIYSLFSAAMIDPLPEKQREFLAVMGFADEFTSEMAETITKNGNTESLLKTLTEQNAFVTRLPGGDRYRFHHMMKECAERTFQTLTPEKQAEYLNRYGAWYEDRGLFLHALWAYRRSGNFSGMLDVVQKDAGILLSSLNPEEVLETLDNCPVPILMKHPFSILVLMRCMFNWRQIPKMMELKGILMTAIESDPGMDPGKKGDLLGECSLILSFLQYNDITAMSRLHRDASEKMSGIAISLRNSGGWTFGSPSVLMMFYRGPGELDKELKEMDECMPHYYKITNGHGQGAERIMRAEASFMQGRFEDSQIELEGAYRAIEGNGQMNMVLCCDFLSWRLSFFTDRKQRCSFEKCYEDLLKHHDIAQINIWRAILAYYYSLSGETGKIPEVFGEHRLSSVNLLPVGKPMHEMIENQVYLAQGDYTKVLGRKEGLLGVCNGLHYALVALHVSIQSAGAYEMLGRGSEAESLLKQAMKEAKPDGMYIPFAENYPYIKTALERMEKGSHKEFIRKIKEYGSIFEAGKERQTEKRTRPEALKILTDREYEIVELMKDRLTNREIAERLFLSEGSVKQYMNQIYSKLRIEGDRRTKRQELLSLLNS